jgi:murein L,D-transpeptidase YcbB/YkuD
MQKLPAAWSVARFVRHRHRSLQALILLICVSTGLVRAQDNQGVGAPEFQAQVEGLLKPGLIEIGGARVAYPKLIYEFYSRRSFRPAWTKTRTASELRRALTDSEADGLDPRDYHMPLLQQLADAAGADKTPSGPALGPYEILHTDALLRIGDHLSFGKVDPRSFDAHWNYGNMPEGDIPQRIESALAGGDIYGEIEKLKPTHRMYRTLKEELAKVRLIAARAEHVTVAPGKAIEPGSQDARVPSLRARLSASGDLDPAQNTASDLYDPTLQSAVQRFQERMGLAADGKVGAGTIAELNVPIEERIRQLRVNLDRGRVLLHDLPQEFVVVNIAAYWVYFLRGQEVVWNARVQVGKTFRQTPIFRSAMDYLVFNPTWTVPPGIIRNDILPEARRDPASISRRGLDVLDAAGNKIDPQSVDWSKFKSGNIPYTLRQEPGPKNALGRVKFMFPNAYSVYLHDTPSQAKFESSDRAFSSGCVRVERPLELAVLLLANTPPWNAEEVRKTIEAGRLQNVTLPNKVPVLLAYWTAWVDPQGRVNFRRDVYGQDAKWAAGLAREYTPRKTPAAKAQASLSGTVLDRTRVHAAAANTRPLATTTGIAAISAP